ncbi:GlcG/HbpS family heme-binding protein [Sandarakinorhabdus oryzae]|uniref:GlcG/HbpS family heme-binding protein n=1 Tax=Sandarakinorhabdus oryzae TaxID=2675220 RepID=UPI0012E0DFA8|nr:heme-binding protein [Sandarakinorhabdus oryzae]
MRALTLLGAALLLAVPATAQLVKDKPTLTLAAARIVTDAAQAEADKRGLKVTIVVVDPAGVPIALRRMDDAPPAGPDIATGKAQTAARFGSPTALYEQRLQKEGQLRYLTFPGAMVASEGGIPLKRDGKTIGAVGVSGGTSQEDGLIAAAGVAALEAALASAK